MRLKTLLNSNEVNFFLVKQGENPNIVLAAVHHAPIGISKLPCDEHPASDEAVGLLALQAAKLLKCTYVVASNYFRDPNKSDDTDYYKWLSRSKPFMLVEIHGHSSEKANFDVEISSGQQRKGASLDFAEKLQGYIDHYQFKNKYTVSGNYHQIHFKATKAVTINTDAWLAFHIELCLDLRKNDLEANMIAKCIAYSVKKIWNETNPKREAK